ncbi:MAG: quinohemoprotein amine dehydrogenase maturation protein [Planctomycetota bacterium]
MNFRTVTHRRFKAGDSHYAYLMPSAAVMRLDEVSTAIMDAFGSDEGVDLDAWFETKNQLEDFDDYRQTFNDMVAMNMIRPADEIMPPPSDAPPENYPLATLVLNVTNKCNLSCTYCYEYGEDKLPGTNAAGGVPRKAMMSTETARESIDFLFDSAKDRPKVTITFFGGETLLNFGTVKQAAEYALKRAREGNMRVDFSLTTNATLLSDEVIDCLVEYGFGVSISIDGNRQAHDKHRVFKSGNGSYDMIVPRIKKLLAKNKGRGRPIGARVTVTAGDTNLRELYRHLTQDIGFDDVGFAPVTSAPGNDYALDGGDYRVLLDEFSALAGEFVEHASRGERHGFSNLSDILREVHLGTNKAHPCGAGLGLLGVSTEGDLGLCHRFVESGDHEVGNVRDGIDEAKRTEFLRKGHISNKLDCANCYARPICAGGCYHEAQVRYGDASKANLHYCDWIRGWMDLGLNSYARIMEKNPSFFKAYERA